ncbi:35790_t:CDS:2, partial [Racocetra persica]
IKDNSLISSESGEHIPDIKSLDESVANVQESSKRVEEVQIANFDYTTRICSGVFGRGYIPTHITTIRIFGSFVSNSSPTHKPVEFSNYSTPSPPSNILDLNILETY